MFAKKKESTDDSVLVSMTNGAVRVVVSWMVKIVAHCCRHQDAHVSHSQLLLRTTNHGTSMI